MTMTLERLLKIATIVVEKRNEVEGYHPGRFLDQVARAKNRIIDTHRVVGVMAFIP